jgi:hypothetical protein
MKYGTVIEAKMQEKEQELSFWVDEDCLMYITLGGGAIKEQRLFYTSVNTVWPSIIMNFYHIKQNQNMVSIFW